MPYISQDERQEIDDELLGIIDVFEEQGWPVGMVNYAISSILWAWFKQRPSYPTINAIVGVLGCAKDEFMRRMAGPYEDTKIIQHGDLKQYHPFGMDGK